MERLKADFCRYDMVCDTPTGIGLEINEMPSFFTSKPKLETEMTHTHAFYEIIWFEEGEGVHYVDFNEYPVQAGAVFFISPGQIHSFDKSHKQRGVVIKVCNRLMDYENSESAHLRYNVFSAFDHVPYCLIPPEENAKLSLIVKDMIAELNEGDSVGHTEYLRSLIKMFMIRVERHNIITDSKVLNPVKSSHKVFLEFRQLIDTDYRSLHTVKEYATRLGVTTKTLNQYVKDCSTYSPLELINNRIVLEAKRLLRYSTLTVKQIAARLGYDDPSYFVKFFKRHTSVPPADYRDTAV